MSTSFIRNKSTWIVLLLIVAFLLPYLRQCVPNFSKSSDHATETTTPVKPAAPPVAVPMFNADSAYAYTKKQVDFGPRVPGTDAHKKCAAWLAAAFRRFGLTVIEQKFQTQAYFGPVNGVNIIAQYKPELNNRVLLCAHWDSRHIADSDTKDKDKPILGADDGASGVAMMLEIARILQSTPLNMGVDLICFDAEDLGDDRDAESSTSMMQQQDQSKTAQTWCLGSQYWAANLHKPGYSAQYGILFDMVGAQGAKFPREGYSSTYAPKIQDKIWSIASELGYGAFFPNDVGGAITDDHLPIMRATRIPMVDIINMPNDPPHVFGAYHHTHNDNMSIIDRNTLHMVGEVTLTMMYRSAVVQ